jgi:hypothetical protein
MIVNVPDKKDAGSAFFLREQCLAQCAAGLRRNHTVKGTVRVALPRLVVEHKNEVSSQRLSPVVVIRKFRRGDSESRENELASSPSAGAEIERIIVLPRLKSKSRIISAGDFQNISSPSDELIRLYG